MLRENCRGVCAKRLTNRFGARRGERRYNAFTILELLVVITIIIVLAGLILSTVGYVQKKGARSRAEAEMAAMSAALESYKADNGIYPRGNADLTPTTPSDTDKVNARTDTDASTYKSASLFLYGELSGDRDHDGTSDVGVKGYMQFKMGSLGRSDMTNPPSNGNKVTMLRDPFGNSYGYSSANAYDVTNNVNPPRGYNPTFDLWSTANSQDPNQWIKNW